MVPPKEEPVVPPKEDPAIPPKQDPVTPPKEEPQQPPKQEPVQPEQNKQLYRAVPQGSASSFWDVPAGAPFSGEIAWMSQAGITRGWSDGTFRPFEAVSREAVAAFLYRMAGGAEIRVPGAMPAAQFNDVSPSHPFYREIEWLRRTGLTRGWPDGSFRGGDSISREAMAAFLHRFVQAASTNPQAAKAISPDLLNLKYPAPVTQFKDVPDGYYFEGDINWLSQTLITTGWDDNTFRPELPIQRQAMAAFFYRLQHNYAK